MKIPIRGMLALETRLCLDRLAKCQPGELVSYAELNEITGCNVQKRRNVISTSISKLLSEQAMVFVPQHGEGIRLLTNEEIPNLGSRDITHIGRIAKRSSRRFAATDYDKLSDTGRIQHNTYMTLLSLIQRGSTKKAIGMIEKAVEKHAHALPLTETIKLFSS